MELLKVKSVDEMKEIMKIKFEGIEPESETVNLQECLNRYLFNDLVADLNVPHFNRSVVDGYAVKLEDVQGASESIPGFLKIIGCAQMGKETKLCLNQGQTVYVPTGGMVPDKTDAMVMIEYTEKMGDSDLAVYSSAGLNENMMLVGDDIKKGQVVLKKGHRLRPQDIGALSAIGYTQIQVFKRPKIGIISTGDEVIRPGQMPSPGEIIDINTPALSALAISRGFEVVKTDYVHDSFAAISEKLKEFIDNCDVVVLSGGSSMGEKDYTVKVIDELGEVFLHGLAVKPGKPTILGKVEGKPVVGLPGQPAAAIMVFTMISDYLNDLFYGTTAGDLKKVTGRLMENIHAAPGRRTFQTVKIIKNDGQIEVWPTYGKSGMITLLSDSHGYLDIAEDTEGLNAGESVQVNLF
ncbi:molybdopterin molybdotransferase MoeA [Eubacteriaceae bacterium ES3]|nr:molybdopterin molybdotransferase MoeA [Eubacteriaceae bacterium ES3]